VPSRMKKQSPGGKSRKKGGGPPAQDTAARRTKPPPRAGVPDADSVIAEKTLKSPKGRVYRILVTDQMDAYDKPQKARTSRSRKR
jgi:hypothetical protein